MRRALAILATALTFAALVIARPALAATGHVRIIWGANRSTFPRWVQAMPGGIPYAARIWYDSTDPATWPEAWPSRAGTNWELVSMRPMPGPLLAGTYDAYFRALFASAPPHSLFTIWHEDANGKAGCTVGPCDPLGYPRALRDPARFRAMQAHMEALVQGTRVRFGTIGCGPVAQAAQWYAPHLDWYGFDFYDNARYWNRDGTLSEPLIWARMTANLAALKQVSQERYPAIRIGESNSGWDRHRKTWFTDVAAWFAGHDGQRGAWVITYWNAAKSHVQGGLSGPWPPGAPVIARLRWLAQTYR